MCLQVRPNTVIVNKIIKIWYLSIPLCRKIAIEVYFALSWCGALSTLILISMKVVHSRFPSLFQTWKCEVCSVQWCVSHRADSSHHFSQLSHAESRGAPGSHFLRLPLLNLPANIDPDCNSKEPMTFLLSSLEFPTSVLRSPNLKRFHLVFVTCKYPAPAMKTGICKMPLKKKRRRKKYKIKCYIKNWLPAKLLWRKKVFTLPTVAGAPEGNW